MNRKLWLVWAVATTAAAIVLAIGVALALAGCSSSGPPVAGTQARNVLVCQHYMRQRAWVLSLAQPTMTDVFRMQMDIAADAGEASGKLDTDLNAMLTATERGVADRAPSERVFYDCKALGVSPPS